MRPHVPLLLVTLLATGGAMLACGQVNNTPAPTPGLSSGIYTYSGSALPLNQCNLGAGIASAFDGHGQQITVSGSSLIFQGGLADPVVVTTAASFVATLVATTFAAPAITYGIDWTTTAAQLASGLPRHLTQGYLCKEADLYGVSGTVTGANVFSRLTDVQWTLVSGSASVCAVAITSEFSAAPAQFPCESLLLQTASM